MKIGEIATQAGVTVDTVRFYERVGVLPAPARTASGYREYEPDTVERIQLTRQLQTIGFTLADAVDALAAHDAGGATCESERWRLDAVLSRVDGQLAELDALRRPDRAGAGRMRRRALHVHHAGEPESLVSSSRLK